MKIAFALYDGFSALDFAALYEPLARRGCAWNTCAISTDVYDANGLHFYPTCVGHSLAGYDMVVVPGGPGAYQRLERADLLSWLATASGSYASGNTASTTCLVAVGDGVLLLAAAGLTKGKRVASRPDRSAVLAGYGALPAREPFVFDGLLATAGSSSAALALSERLCEKYFSQTEEADLLLAPPLPVTGDTAASSNDEASDEAVVSPGAAASSDAAVTSGAVPPRRAVLSRQTGETQVEVALDIDGSGSHQIETGLPFLDHMLAQVAVHGLFDLSVKAIGDLAVDPHHTLEDVALTLGSAFQQALGDRAGIVRMASADCPMDESLAWVAVDFSGRPYSVIQADWHSPVVGGLPSSLFAHFFESFAASARCNLHAAVRYGRDDHHQAEALFKAFGRALCAATRLDPRRAHRVPSSKGVLF